MSKLAQLQAQAADIAAVSADMTEAVKGGGGARLLPVGYAFGRLVEYVELGMQQQTYNGTPKDPALEAQLGFALWGQGYQNEDGTPYLMRLFPFAISRNDKAKSFKLFKLLNWDGLSTHFAQLIGKGFLVRIEHEPKSKTDATIVSRIQLDKFLPPIDPVTAAPYAIPEAPDSMLRLFLWEKPTKEAWDELYQEGKWDDGSSKNRLQETIMGAIDFQGSPLQQLLGGSIPELPSNPTSAALNGNVVASPLVPSVVAVAPSAPHTNVNTVSVPPVTMSHTNPAQVVAAPLAPVVGAVAPPTVPLTPVVPA